MTETEEEIRKRKKKREEEDEARRNRNSDDGSVLGSPILDGLIGIPSSPMAIAIDIATPGGLF